MVLLIDGNYLLHRNVFSLVKDKLLYGNLEDAMFKTVNAYAKWFPFKKVHFISDAKTNWRKTVYPEYKGNRTKDDKVDWDYVNVAYDNFKEDLPIRFNKLQSDLLEGDDWISYYTRYYNRLGESVLIVSNDGDIKQLLDDSPKYINIMVNENNLYNNIYICEGYKTWLATEDKRIGLPSLFDDDVNEDRAEYDFIKQLLSKRDIKEVKTDKVLFEKIVGGDRGDNVKSVYIKNNRGIGEKTAEKIYNKYVDYFGTPIFDDECFDRMTDIVIEQKKIDSEEFTGIKNKILLNNKIVNLQRLPKKVIKIIKEKHENG